MNPSQSSVLWARWVFAILLVSATVAFFWQFPPSQQPGLPYADKLVHFGIFFVLSATLHKAFALPGRWSFLLLACYGLLIEVVQSYLPGRGSDIYDWLADSLGVLAYFGIVYWLRKR